MLTKCTQELFVEEEQHNYVYVADGRGAEVCSGDKFAVVVVKGLGNASGL